MVKNAMIRRIVPFALLAVMACSSSKVETEKAVANVNGAIITAVELQQEVTNYGKNYAVTRHTVDDRLGTMIEQKLLIQEAVKMGLNEDKKFAETIKTFWEQTIIRNLIEAKTSELSGKIFVTDQEIAHEYDKMKYRPRIIACRGARTKQEADAIVRRMESGERIAGEEIIGPLFYEDVKNSPLVNAFDLKTGQVCAVAAADEHIVIRVINREEIPLPPLKELSKRIRESLLMQKRQEAIAGWIAKVKSAAKIRIDEKELRRIAHE
ncbi:MAG TPA: hypothetical protein VJZ49_09190 [Syntrophales bacterium]|nr:hypothetical protein [Syntrophales bacterium]